MLLPIKGGIERSSIAQVEPSDKVVSSKAITSDSKQEPLKMAFQNPCLEYSTENNTDIVDSDLISCVKYPTMKKSDTKVNIPGEVWIFFLPNIFEINHGISKRYYLWV